MMKCAREAEASNTPLRLLSWMLLTLDPFTSRCSRSDNTGVLRFYPNEQRTLAGDPGCAQDDSEKQTTAVTPTGKRV